MNLPPLKHYYQFKENSYRNKYEHVPQWPFRLLICGVSGSGKTNVLLNLILQYLTYDKIYLFAKDLTEPKYEYLQDLFKSNTDDAVFTQDRSIISVDELDPSKQNLIIFDDYVTEKYQQDIEDLFIRGRKKNASIIYLTQSYYRTPKNIRLQCDYIILMKSCNQREINYILKEHSVDDTIKGKYDTAVKDPYNFFLIDLKTQDPKLKFRKNFNNTI